MNAVIKSKQFPFRFLSAYQAIEQLANENYKEKLLSDISKKLSSGGKTADADQWWQAKKAKKLQAKIEDTNYSVKIVHRYLKALKKAVNISAANNIQPIKGVSLILLNGCAELDQPNKLLNVFPSDMQKCFKASAMLAAMCLTKCERGLIVLYSEDEAYEEYNLINNDILQNLNEICKLNEDSNYSKSSSNGVKSLECITKSLILRERPDESCKAEMDVLNDFLHMYRKRINPDLLFVRINVSANCVGPDDSVKSNHINDVYISGFSDQVLRLIAERGGNGQLMMIEKIDSRYELKSKPQSFHDPKSDAVKERQPISLDNVLSPIKIPKWRTTQVFISSTFLDMYAERDLLVRFVFPELRERAKCLYLKVYEVDFRWGLVESQSEKLEILFGYRKKLKPDAVPTIKTVLSEQLPHLPDHFMEIAYETSMTMELEAHSEHAETSDLLSSTAVTLPYAGNVKNSPEEENFHPQHSSTPKRKSGKIRRELAFQKRERTREPSKTRRKKGKSICRVFETPDIPIPQDYQGFLCNSRSKADLANFHSQELIRNALDNKCVITAGGLTEATDVSCSRPGVDVEGLRSTHEEADTHLFQHYFLSGKPRKKDSILKYVELLSDIGRDPLTRLLEMCLREVSKSEFFIGMLGERYGWIPDVQDLPNDPTFDWVKDCPSGTSVTELEMYAAGIFDESQKHKHKNNTFFFIRDSTFIKDVPPEWIEHFIEHDSTKKQKVTALQDKMITSGFEAMDARYPCEWGGVFNGKPVVKGLNHFGQSVIDNLWYAFTNTYNSYNVEYVQASELDHESNLHEDFANRRIEEYVLPTNLLKHTDNLKQISKNSGLFCIMGRPGSGKTSLMAFLYGKFASQNPSVIHFVGLTPNSDNVAALLRHICYDIITKFSLEIRLPDTYNELVKIFFLIISNAVTVSPTKRLFIFIDGMNLLSTSHQAADLTWLPTDIPSGVSIVCSSTSDSEISEKMSNISKLQMSISPLELATRQNIVINSLGKYRKVLDSSPFNNLLRLLTSKQDAGLPLFIELACQKLRHFGVHENMSKIVKSLSTTLKLLLQDMLMSLESEFGQDMIKVSLLLILNSHKGLDKYELHQLLNLHSHLKNDKVDIVKVQQILMTSSIKIAPALFIHLIQRLEAFLMPLHQKKSSPNLTGINGSTHDKVKRAGETFVLKLYGASNFESLDKYRHIAYKKAIGRCSPSSSFQLASLPPTSAAAKKHSYRTYHTVQEWMGNTLPPIEWGWRSHDGTLAPVETDRPVAPESLLNMVPWLYMTQVKRTLDSTMNEKHARALSSLPYHLANSNCLEELLKLITQINFLQAKLDLGLGNDILSDFTWNSTQGSKSVYKKQQQIFSSNKCILQFKSFLERNLHRLLSNPALLLQLALNEPNHTEVHIRAQNVIQGNDALRSHILEWRYNKRINEDCLFTFSDNDMIPTCILAIPHSELILIGCFDGLIQLYDCNVKKKIKRFVGHSNSITSLKMIGSNKFCSSSKDTSLSIWNIVNGLRLSVLQCHSRDVIDCAIDSDKMTIVSVGYDCKICLWAVTDGRLISKITSERLPHNCVKFYPSKQEILVGGWDKLIKSWDLINMTKKYTFRGHKSSVQNISINLAGTTAVSASMTEILLWSLSNQMITYYKKFHANELLVSPCGTNIIVNDDDKDSTSVFKSTTGKKAYSYARNFAVTAIAMSDSVDLLISSEISKQVTNDIITLMDISFDEIYVGTSSGVVMSVNVESKIKNSVKFEYNCQNLSPVTALILLFSELFVGNEDGTLCWFKMEDAKENFPKSKIQAHNGSIVAIKEITSSIFVTLGSDKVLKFFNKFLIEKDFTPFKIIENFKAELLDVKWDSIYAVPSDGMMKTAKYVPDDRFTWKDIIQLPDSPHSFMVLDDYILTGSNNGKIDVYDENGKLCTSIEKIVPGQSFLFSANSYNSNLCVQSHWSESINENEDENKEINDRKPVPDFLICAETEFGTVSVFIPFAVENVSRFNGHLDKLNGLAMSTSNIFTSSVDKSIKIWSMRENQKIDYDHDNSVRNVTISKRRNCAVSFSVCQETNIDYLILWNTKPNCQEPPIKVTNHSLCLNDYNCPFPMFLEFCGFEIVYCYYDSIYLLTISKQKDTSISQVHSINRLAEITTSFVWDVKSSLLFRGSYNGRIHVYNLANGRKIVPVFSIRMSSPNLTGINGSTHDKVKRAGETFVLKLYGASSFESLDKYRHIAYKRAIGRCSPSSSFQLASLPPTSAAAKKHSYSNYHTVQEWMGNTLPPIEWGWRSHDGTLVPVETDRPVAPKSLLNMENDKWKSSAPNYFSCLPVSAKIVHVNENKPNSFPTSIASTIHYLIVGDDEGRVAIFNHDNPKVRCKFQIHTMEVTKCLVLNEYLFTSSLDGSVKIWKLENEVDRLPQIAQFDCHGPVTSMDICVMDRTVDIMVGDKIGNVVFLKWHPNSKI
ncbi:Telomerase protein component 1 [Nymphon striatum]|nr:Telomerase protein component 1 [Nymphon striatum]